MSIPYDENLIWIIVVGFVVAFVLAFGIGANDVANSFGTSVGAGVLTIFQACILATVFEIAGAVLIGYKVSDTMRKGILDVTLYEGHEKELMLGALSSLAGSGIWLLLATALRLPISGTHSIVGATVGFSLVCRGTAGVKWIALGNIAASWFASPVLSGVVSASIFWLLRKSVLRSSRPLEQGLHILPLAYGLTVAVNVMSVAHDGPKLLMLDRVPWWGSLIAAIGLGLFSAIIVYLFVVPWQRKRILLSMSSDEKTTKFGTCDRKETTALSVISETPCSSSNGNAKEGAPKLRGNSSASPLLMVTSSEVEGTQVENEVKEEEQPEVSKLFSFLQVLTAAFGSFAHGGNDVSNAIGPLIALWAVYAEGSAKQEADTPLLILLYGGLGISTGLWIWGRRVIQTLGQDLARITPTTGFTIEVGAAVTVLLASKAGLPVSTTHCKVGSVVCVGWASRGGYTFQDPTIREYKLPHKFDILNGFRVSRDRNIGFGGKPIDAESVAFTKDSDPIQYDPSLTYGRVREYGKQQFVPHYALFAQKCLSFKAFFRQGVFNSANEHFRIRYVNILYFLEDDTVCIIEPTIDNAGFPQGKLVKRHKVTKNTSGDFFHWKDLNVGIDICIYGVVYHIVDCDLFTREFLSSQGIDVGDREDAPPDPYLQTRAFSLRVPERITPIPDDNRRRFLEYDRMVLSFDATWNEDAYQIMYFLSDDTIAIREIAKPNNGKDPVSMLLRRMKIPKDWKNMPSSFPSSYMEYGDTEVAEYYTPKDFAVGNTVFIFNRRFLLHDCDAFTRKYYRDMLGISQPEKIPLPSQKSAPAMEYRAPPHIKFGTPEDTYSTCLSFVPRKPRKNVVRQLLNFPKKLRYSLRMEAVHPEDENRNFVLEYSLSEGTILIVEIEKRNSGRREGCFLKATLVPKPGTNKDDPEYYTPQDLFIGAKINVFNHRFIVNGADLFVYRYIEANPEKFCQEVRDNIRDYFTRQNMLAEDIALQGERIRIEESERLLDDANDNVKRADAFSVRDCDERSGMVTKTNNPAESKDHSF
ncbi:hypothetical protein KM043_007749 [Ampulex compressa]|nr:hypothetical protein KM043_007749 [Ampulex compressa]